MARDAELDRLKEAHEVAFQRKQSAYYAQRDGRNALALARYELSQARKTRREAHGQHNRTWQQAKADFHSRQQQFDVTKVAYDQLQLGFTQLKADFDSIDAEYRARLEMVLAKRRQDDRQIALDAGVPDQYSDDVRVCASANGVINIYFGGINAPDGIGHGHYVVGDDGNLLYRRDPFQARGVHNYLSNQLDNQLN